MAMNPMQRRARTSFLLGMLLTLLITGAAIGILIYMLGQEKEKHTTISYKEVYVVSKEIKSGEKIVDITDIENANIKKMQVDITLIPSNAIIPALKDLEGNVISGNSNNYITENATAKIGLDINTILTTDMVNTDGQGNYSDVRLQEYNMVVLPTYLQENEYIDIRLRLPSGEDYIVLSKKYVEKTNNNTIWIKVREDEILTMSNAIVEAYIMNGSYLYATTYTDAGTQNSSIPTYIAKNSVISLMNSDSNITATAKSALVSRYNEEARTQRELVNNALNNFNEDALTNVQERVQEEIQKQQTARQEYITSLSADDNEI